MRAIHKYTSTERMVCSCIVVKLLWHDRARLDECRACGCQAQVAKSDVKVVCHKQSFRKVAFRL